MPILNDKRIDRLKERVKERYNSGDPGHDFAHIERVFKICQEIGLKKNANLSVLLPAALLHDVVNLPKDHPDRTNASEMAANEAKKILLPFDYNKNEIERIATVILEHSYSLGKEPSCIESAILQDADRLDAIGAIGIMRMVTCGCRLGSSYYDLDDPFAKDRELDDKTFTIDHLYVKLFNLAEKMNTSEAKIEARKRSKFMEDFVSELKREAFKWHF